MPSVDCDANYSYVRPIDRQDFARCVILGQPPFLPGQSSICQFRTRRKNVRNCFSFTPASGTPRLKFSKSDCAFGQIAVTGGLCILDVCALTAVTRPCDTEVRDRITTVNFHDQDGALPSSSCVRSSTSLFATHGDGSDRISVNGEGRNRVGSTDYNRLVK